MRDKNAICPFTDAGLGADCPMRNKVATRNKTLPSLFDGSGKGWLFDPIIRIIAMVNSKIIRSHRVEDSSKNMLLPKSPDNHVVLIFCSNPMIQCSFDNLC